MFLRLLVIAWVLLSLAPMNAWARGGGGCFLKGTPVLTSDGTSKPIEDLKPGDEVLSITDDGHLVHATLLKLFIHQEEEYLRVSTPGGVICVTPEHPFRTREGTFRAIGEWKVGEQVTVHRGQELTQEPITQIERIAGPVTVYNLSVDGPNTYFAGNIAVHNKGGGCFPAGTMIQTPDGLKAIQTLKPGDIVLAVDGDGLTVNAAVTHVYKQRSNLLTLQTTMGEIRTTDEHPMMARNGKFAAAGLLKPGDEMVAWRDGKMILVPVIGTQTGEEADVYNLTVDGPHTYIAEGFVVHNKGGGFGGGGGRSSSFSRGYSGGSGSSQSGSSNNEFWLVVILVVFVALSCLVIYWEIKDRQNNGSGPLDVLLTAAIVEPRARAAARSLLRVVNRDRAFEKQVLEMTARNTFSKLQECWQNRNYSPMRPLMMPDLFAQHAALLQGMVQSHEINMVDVKTIDSIVVIQVRYGKNIEEREFTVLITATASDYYVDDRTSNLVRGTTTPEQFQEFWTFQQSNGRGPWLLRDIEQTAESDILSAEDDLSGLPEEPKTSELANLPAHQEIAASAATQSRLTLLLASLEKKNRAWRNNNIVSAARDAYTSVYMARHAGAVAGLRHWALTQELIRKESKEIAQRAMRGERVGYFNFCIRRVQIVLASDARQTDKALIPATVTVRVFAHARKVITNNQTVVWEDPDITAFSEMCDLVLEDDAWKMTRMTPNL